MIIRASVKPETMVLYSPDAAPSSLVTDLKGGLFYDGIITTEQPAGPLVRIAFNDYDFNTRIATMHVRNVALWTLFPHPHNARYILAEARTPAGYLDYDGYWVRNTPDFKVAMVAGANATYLAERLRSGLHRLGGPASQVSDLLADAAAKGIIKDSYTGFVWKLSTVDETAEPEPDLSREVHTGTPAVARQLMALITTGVMSLRPYQCANCDGTTFHIRDTHTGRFYTLVVADGIIHPTQTQENEQ